MNGNFPVWKKERALRWSRNSSPIILKGKEKKRSRRWINRSLVISRFIFDPRRYSGLQCYEMMIFFCFFSSYGRGKTIAHVRVRQSSEESRGIVVTWAWWRWAGVVILSPADSHPFSVYTNDRTRHIVTYPKLVKNIKKKRTMSWIWSHPRLTSTRRFDRKTLPSVAHTQIGA